MSVFSWCLLVLMGLLFGVYLGISLLQWVRRFEHELEAEFLESEQGWCGTSPARVECAWCMQVLRGGSEPVSHGICPDCLADQRNGFSAVVAALDKLEAKR